MTFIAPSKLNASRSIRKCSVEAPPCEGNRATAPPGKGRRVFWLKKLFLLLATISTFSRHYRGGAHHNRLQQTFRSLANRYARRSARQSRRQLPVGSTMSGPTEPIRLIFRERMRSKERRSRPLASTSTRNIGARAVRTRAEAVGSWRRI